jgi:hypothetical protein
MTENLAAEKGRDVLSSDRDRDCDIDHAGEAAYRLWRELTLESPLEFFTHFDTHAAAGGVCRHQSAEAVARVREISSAGVLRDEFQRQPRRVAKAAFKVAQ